MGKPRSLSLRGHGLHGLFFRDEQGELLREGNQVRMRPGSARNRLPVPVGLRVFRIPRIHEAHPHEAGRKRAVVLLARILDQAAVVNPHAIVFRKHELTKLHGHEALEDRTPHPHSFAVRNDEHALVGAVPMQGSSHVAGAHEDILHSFAVGRAPEERVVLPEPELVLEALVTLRVGHLVEMAPVALDEARVDLPVVADAVIPGSFHRANIGRHVKAVVIRVFGIVPVLAEPETASLGLPDTKGCEAAL